MGLATCRLPVSSLGASPLESLVSFANQLKDSFTGPVKWRGDSRCGAGYPLHNGKLSECDPDGFHCCNSTNHCGNTTGDCTCDNCIDYKGKIIRVYSRSEYVTGSVHYFLKLVFEETNFF